MKNSNHKPIENSKRMILILMLSAAGLLLAFGVITFLVIYIRMGDISGLAILEVLAAVLAGVAGTYIAARWNTSLERKMQAFSVCTESATRAAIMSFPSPMLIADMQGEVVWCNQSMEELAEKESMVGEYVQNVFEGIPFAKFAETANPSPEEFDYKDRSYLISGRSVRDTREGYSGTMVAMYFTDLTLLKELQQQMNDKKTVLCMAQMDNYDEIMKSTPTSNHGALVSEMERCVRDWTEQGEGVFVRYERDKFLILFETKKFQPLLEEKFTVLQKMKEIEQGNRFPATLSIGVGRGGESLAESQKTALGALEMALGRGGDQAVFKTDKGYQFYGAKSREIEKSTKVKARVVAHALKELSEQASNVILMGHKNADADCLGAAVGLFRAFRRRKIEAYIALDRNKNNTHAILDSFLKNAEYQNRILPAEKLIPLMNGKTLLIILDTHRPSMVEYPELLQHTKEKVLIDHHRRSEDFMEDTVLSYHEPYASSTCELVTEMLPYMAEGGVPEPYEAEALYSGIYIDTKGFTFKTGVRTFEAASYLRRLGADPVNVRKLFRNDLNMYILKSRIISCTKIYRDNIALAQCDGIGSESQLVVALAADELLNIEGIEASFVLAAVGENVVISGRSFGTVNVQLILEKLGGGGHITIAGAQLKNKSLDLAEMQLQTAIDEALYDEVPLLSPKQQ